MYIRTPALGCGSRRAESRGSRGSFRGGSSRARALHDLVSITVDDGNDRAQKPARDAAVVDVHVFVGIRDASPLSGIASACGVSACCSMVVEAGPTTHKVGPETATGRGTLPQV